MSVVIILLSGFLLMISFLVSLKEFLDSEMTMSFECGFDTFNLVRSSFSLHFFKICLIFVFFDIEIIIVLPLPILMKMLTDLFIYMYMILMVIITGLFFEWYQGSIDWFY